ncbi:hypothetical protein IV511_07030 [Enterobacter quasihormaechei]|uniref:hypothetical protein n=1 Tax=Enterobacter quasihormaechei TaxID=2529382 RepID=UPI002F421307
MFILITILMVAFVSVCVFISLSKGNPNGVSLFERFYLFLVMAFVVSSVISGLIAFFAYKACAPTRCKLAEEIFQLLGMRRVATINLNKITKKHEQQLKDNGKGYEPGDKSKPACPSGKFIYSDEGWFYY